MQTARPLLDVARLTAQLQRRHRPLPSSSPPFRCSEPDCDRAFNRKYTLTEHEKTHLGQKPYVCPVKSCGKRFTTTGNLSRHRRLHGPVQPLACPVDGCPCAFSSDLKLVKHMKFHFSVSVQLCSVHGCGRTFSTIGNLNRHLRNQHNIYDDLSTSSPLTRSPNTQQVEVAQSPTSPDDSTWLFAFSEVSHSASASECGNDDDEDDDTWFAACLSTVEPLTLEEATRPWDSEALQMLSLLLDSDSGDGEEGEKDIKEESNQSQPAR